MAHDIANINGIDSMFCVGNRDAAWHHLGQRTGDVVTWREAIKLANLDWTVSKRPLYFRPENQQPGQPAIKVPDVMAVTRSTDGAYLGTVGDGFELIQNAECFNFVDALLQAENGAHYETAGALGNGATVWTLARLPYDSIIRGTEDKTSNYLMLATAHDGTMSLIVKLVRERVVCRNTMAVALGEAGKQLKFKHTKNVRIKMEDAKRVMLGVRADVEAHDAVLNSLATRKMTKENMTAVMDRLFPVAKGADGRSTRQNNVAAMILQLFESNDNNAIPQIRGSALNMLNAVTEYTDHFRSARITDARQGMTSIQARAENALFGTGSAFKNDAAVAILEATADAPSIQSAAVRTVGSGDWLKDMGISL